MNVFKHNISLVNQSYILFLIQASGVFSISSCLEVSKLVQLFIF